MTNNLKKNLIIGGVVIGTSALSSVATLLIHTKWCYHTLYKYAAQLVEKGQYKKAMDTFGELGDYKNSPKYYKICQEKIAIHQIEDMIEEKDYQSAAWMFDSVCDQGILSNRNKNYIHTKLLKLSDELEQDWE